MIVYVSFCTHYISTHAWWWTESCLSYASIWLLRIDCSTLIHGRIKYLPTSGHQAQTRSQVYRSHIFHSFRTAAWIQSCAACRINSNSSWKEKKITKTASRPSILVWRDRRKAESKQGLQERELHGTESIGRRMSCVNQYACQLFWSWHIMVVLRPPSTIVCCGLWVVCCDFLFTSALNFESLICHKWR